MDEISLLNVPPEFVPLHGTDVNPDSDPGPPLGDQTPADQNLTSKAHTVRSYVDLEALLEFVPEHYANTLDDKEKSSSGDYLSHEDPLFSEKFLKIIKETKLMPQFILQMMFVAGETGEPSGETTTLIEQIVHEQVYEMVCYLCVRSYLNHS